MAISQSPYTRVIRATPNAPAGLMIEEKSISLIGTSQNFVKVNSNGTAVRGPETHISLGMQRRVAGLWIEEFEMLGMIPKTIVTLFPKILPVPPMLAMANMAQDVAFFAALLV